MDFRQFEHVLVCDEAFGRSLINVLFLGQRLAHLLGILEAAGDILYDWFVATRVALAHSCCHLVLFIVGLLNRFDL